MALLPSAAQAGDAEACKDLDTVIRGGEGEQFQQFRQPRYFVPACLNAVTNRESLIAISNMIHRHVAGELLGAGSSVAEPAGLTMSDPEDVLARLAGPGTITVVPTADVTAPAPTRKWNIWVDGKYSWIDGSSDISDADGPLVNFTGGIDYKITDRVVLGLMGLYERSKLEIPGSAISFPSSTKNEGFGGGAYLGVTLTSNIVFSALVNGTFFDNDYDFFFSDASTDSDRVQASAGFTGYWYSTDLWRWSPSASASWSGEWLDAYTDSLDVEFAKQKVESGVLTLGNVVGKTFSLGGDTSVEPWAGAILEYTFLSKAETDGADTIDYGDTVDIRLQSGFNLNLAANVQLLLLGEVAGLLLDESNTYAGEANLAIQF